MGPSTVLKELSVDRSKDSTVNMQQKHRTPVQM